ncbi:DNA recombination protein RmuC [Acetobacteraceae bacterium]|nr:DNA recombination protein RmuC [Acetobacteraceae bacterium]
MLLNVLCVSSLCALLLLLFICVGILKLLSQKAAPLSEETVLNFNNLRLSAEQENRHSREILLSRMEGASKAQLEALVLMRDALNLQLQSFSEKLDGFRQENFTALKTFATETQQQAQSLQEKMRQFGDQNSERMAFLQQGVEQRLEKMRESNEAKLEQMRVTVDEKLQGTLEKRLGAAFSTVNENLDRVSSSVGEMRKIADNVGDLKKVLGNIKTRGIWGEGQLESMLEDSLSSDQFAKNVEIRPGSKERVEFAIRLPGAGNSDSDKIWLPIDAKLPVEDYERLIDALEAGNSEAEKEAGRALERRVYECAKDIRDKYVQPPFSTDMGIMFLPTEGLFAEVVRRPGVIDRLQIEFRVIVAGPTTLMALLSSLRMGFRSLAVHQRSGEISKLLGGIKTEFGKFGNMLDKVEKKLQEAQNVLSKEGGTRFRVMRRALKGAEEISEGEAQSMLGLSDSDEDEFTFSLEESPKSLSVGEKH